MVGHNIEIEDPNDTEILRRRAQPVICW